MAIELLLGRKVQPPQIALNSTGLLLIELDLAVSEEHQYKNMVTRFPVEDGSDITDNVRPEPERLVLEGFVTNSPIQYLAALRDNPVTSGAGKDRVVTAYELLLSIAGYRMAQANNLRTKSITRSGHTTQLSKALLVDIYTTLRVFTDMVLESLVIPRDAQTGDSLRFKAEFIKITKATTETATIQYTNEKKYGSGGAIDQAAKTEDAGKKSTTPSDNRTILKRMVDGGKAGLTSTFSHIREAALGLAAP